MRIALAGKGGSGKTTLSATIARLFAQRGYQVNAVDDDPNPNLATALGLTQEQQDHLKRVDRDSIMEERQEGDDHVLRLTQPFESVLKDYGAIGPDGVNVLMMTGLLGAGRG